MLHHVDPVRANPELLAKLINHPQNSVRAAAHNILKESPKAEWIPLLEPALHSESADARWRAVDLVASTADAAAVPLLFEHLHDPRAKVAIRAVEFLARFPGEQIEVELMRRAFGERWILRPSAYAVLALVEREDSRQTPLLGPGHVDALLRGMNVKDPFVAGACAVALAGIGFRSEGQAEVDWLDSIVPSQLVSLIAGQTYFKDREALVGVAVRRLQLITAKSTGWLPELGLSGGLKTGAASGHPGRLSQFSPRMPYVCAWIVWIASELRDSVCSVPLGLTVDHSRAPWKRSTSPPKMRGR